MNSTKKKLSKVTTHMMTTMTTDLHGDLEVKPACRGRMKAAPPEEARAQEIPPDGGLVRIPVVDVG